MHTADAAEVEFHWHADFMRAVEGLTSPEEVKSEEGIRRVVRYVEPVFLRQLRREREI